MQLILIARYVAFRILQGIPLLLGVILINFTLIHAAPGDPVTVMIGPGTVSQEFIDQVRRDLGLDRPFLVQLATYVTNVAQGDLGISYSYRQPVIDVVLSRVPATLLLMGTAYILASLVGIGLGVISALRPRSWIDNFASVISVIGYSVPAFWTSFLAILVFALTFRWFPAGGMVDVRSTATGFGRVVDILHHLVLPALVLTFFYSALIARLTRGSMMEILQSDFILMARAKGLSNRRVTFRHALPNAILPVVTIIGLQFGDLLAGAVLTETVFAWPGLGRLIIDAAGQRDFPLLMGVFIIATALTIGANIVTDIVYMLIDPRIRLSAKSA
jgi:ABC-type dipeptide/oligopeptide/nickel transport system permease component